MRAIKGLRAIVAPLVVLAMVGMSGADVMFGASGGFSWPIDERADAFKPGWNAGVHGFLVATPNLLLGGRVAYHRWGLDKAEIIAQNPVIVNRLLGVDIDGATNVVELMPAVRLRSNMQDWIVNLFAQAGVGVYIRATNASVEGYDPET
ncbi:MAG: hypothetical protein GF344_16455, partial [Chitinivibrionales bacterium]|nr:hypothetical protein [Chitinivibrionales bacterium]